MAAGTHLYPDRFDHCSPAQSLGHKHKPEREEKPSAYSEDIIALIKGL